VLDISNIQLIQLRGSITVQSDSHIEVNVVWRNSSSHHEMFRWL
jgi:hypothetical protein